MTETIDLLVRADVLYPMTGDGDVVLDGEVAIRGDRILHAGARRAEGAWQAARTISGTGRAVLPGFVNAHCHTASIIFRGQSDDGAGGAALYTVAFRGEPEVTPDQWRDLATLGVIDMIKAGITTINDVWHEPEALAEVALAAGLRAQIAQKVVDVHLEELHHGDYTRDPALGEARLRRGVALAERWHGAGDGRITCRIGAHATDTCSEGLHREAAAEARRLGIGLHTHAAQSKAEVDYIQANHGKGPVEFLRDIGVLGPESVLAHLTFATQGDLDAVRDAGAGYAHCATIYPRRGVYPDMAAIRARGIRWGLATDWMMNDPFEAMRNALNAIRLRQGDHRALDCREALHRATLGAAEVIGLGSQTGCLAEGRKADLIQIDIDQPHLAPFYADFASVAYYARASDVVTSVIDGRPVMEERRVLGLDEAEALANVRRHLPGWTALMRRLGGAGHPGLCACGHH